MIHLNSIQNEKTIGRVTGGVQIPLNIQAVLHNEVRGDFDMISDVGTQVNFEAMFIVLEREVSRSLLMFDKYHDNAKGMEHRRIFRR